MSSEINYELLMSLPDVGPGVNDLKVAEQIEIQAKYAGYIDRQLLEIEKHIRHEESAITCRFRLYKSTGIID